MTVAFERFILAFFAISYVIFFAFSLRDQICEFISEPSLNGLKEILVEGVEVTAMFLILVHPFILAVLLK